MAGCGEPLPWTTVSLFTHSNSSAVCIYTTMNSLFKHFLAGGAVIRPTAGQPILIQSHMPVNNSCATSTDILKWLLVSPPTKAKALKWYIMCEGVGREMQAPFPKRDSGGHISICMHTMIQVQVRSHV